MKLLINPNTNKILTISGNAVAMNATEEIDIATVSSITQVQYDALSTKVEDTLYLITGGIGYTKAYLGEIPLYMVVDESKRKRETASGTLPITFTTLNSGIVISLIRYGKCEQSGTPTTSSPLNIVCNNGILKWDKTNNVLYTDGTPEEIQLTGGTQGTVYTASVEMLLAIGDYIDTQDIISGAISRNVGVKVFDGTETFTTAVLTNCWALSTPLGVGAPTSRRVYCTHFNSADTLPSAGNRQGYALIGLTDGSTNYTIGFGATSAYSTETAFKNWLAAQYAAGTPVIVVYPLTVPTTASVTAQPINTFKGNNNVFTTANVSSPQATITYQK